ncbi:MAG: sensor domain-containing diguanylate cyclase [Candidatus Nitrotoga sp.]
MTKPAIPPNEGSRLKALHSLNVLDTLAEDRFDRLTRMAKAMFDVPVALVSLVDENRQWFKSCIGINTKETSRDFSFCGHTILGDEALIIPDATRDERFAGNPLVIGDPKIRFYAGYPLTVMHKWKIGTLCIVDFQPRNFSLEQIALLKDLASMVEKELMAVQMATLDEITNLPNRRGFMSIANKLLAWCDRNNSPATLAFFDLKNFKAINDTFGHNEGDNALIEFAEQLDDMFRESDALARLGGDEFVVLLTDVSKQEITERIESFKVHMEVRNVQAKRGYDITFSYGLVDFDSATHHSIEYLLSHADTLMYEHKKKKLRGGTPFQTEQTSKTELVA